VWFSCLFLPLVMAVACWYIHGVFVRHLPLALLPDDMLSTISESVLEFLACGTGSCDTFAFLGVHTARDQMRWSNDYAMPASFYIWTVASIVLGATAQKKTRVFRRFNLCALFSTYCLYARRGMLNAFVAPPFVTEYILTSSLRAAAPLYALWLYALYEASKPPGFFKFLLPTAHDCAWFSRFEHKPFFYHDIDAVTQHLNAQDDASWLPPDGPDYDMAAGIWDSG
jgi:hypothetical protein